MASALTLQLGALGTTAASSENLVSLEANPLIPSLAPPTKALTFAQTFATDGRIATLMVVNFKDDAIRAVDLTALGALPDADIFDAISTVGRIRLEQAFDHLALHRTYPLADLLPSAGAARWHVANGTNFLEHAQEADIDEVFNFPKFGPATPARSTVVLKKGDLLDYEVEICSRFDRDLRSVEDFDQAQKGFFLCGDFSDRAKLMRLVNPADVASGEGFSDAKSGADFFPTGPFLVVPHNWRAFVRSERMVTHVNGRIRQDARGGEMILDFRQLVAKALTDGGGGTYKYQGVPVPLLEHGYIPRGAALMSGTSEGVIFMPPAAGDYVMGVLRHVITGPIMKGDPAMMTLVETFIEKEHDAGRYLKVGDVVTHASSSMGDVSVRVIPDDENR